MFQSKASIKVLFSLARAKERSAQDSRLPECSAGLWSVARRGCRRLRALDPGSVLDLGSWVLGLGLGLGLPSLDLFWLLNDRTPRCSSCRLVEDVGARAKPILSAVSAEAACFSSLNETDDAEEVLRHWRYRTLVMATKGSAVYGLPGCMQACDSFL